MHESLSDLRASTTECAGNLSGKFTELILLPVDGIRRAFPNCALNIAILVLSRLLMSPRFRIAKFVHVVAAHSPYVRVRRRNSPERKFQTGVNHETKPALSSSFATHFELS